MKLTTSAQMKELDRQAIEERHIPSIDLMERAAEALARGALSLLPEKPGKCRAAVFCGSGNNGGDGIGAARYLFLAGVKVRAFLVGSYDKMTPDALEETRRLSECGVALELFDRESDDQRRWAMTSHVMVDALFGVGLSREIRADSDHAAAISWMNDSRGAVAAADIPSGVAADTGKVLGMAVKADKTITFTLPKLGHWVGQGGVDSGEVTVADIGIPADLTAGLACPAQTVEPDFLRASLPPRKVREIAGGGRRRGIYRSALSCRRRSGAQRLRPGVSRRAGEHLAGGGRQVRLRHAVPAPGQEGNVK